MHVKYLLSLEKISQLNNLHFEHVCIRLIRLVNQYQSIKCVLQIYTYMYNSKLNLTVMIHLNYINKIIFL